MFFLLRAVLRPSADFREPDGKDSCLCQSDVPRRTGAPGEAEAAADRLRLFGHGKPSLRDLSCPALDLRGLGRVKGMQCPKLSGLVQIMPPFLEETGFSAEYESGIVGNSSEIDWRKF